jgi:hypothetical protein
LGLQLKVRFKEVFSEDPAIAPGGFCVETREQDGSIRKWYFDFVRSRTSKSTIPGVLNFCMEELDVSSFPESVGLLERLDRIVKIRECFIYTGEHGELGTPVELMEFAFAMDEDSSALETSRIANGEYMVAFYGGPFGGTFVAKERLLKEAVLTGGTEMNFV